MRLLVYALAVLLAQSNTERVQNTHRMHHVLGFVFSYVSSTAGVDADIDLAWLWDWNYMAVDVAMLWRSCDGNVHI